MVFILVCFEYYREKIYPLPALDLEIGLDEDVICVEVNTKLKNLNIVLRTKSFVWDYEHDRSVQPFFIICIFKLFFRKRLAYEVNTKNQTISLKHAI